MHMKEVDLDRLSIAAWTVRDHAFIYGKTKVGAALLTEDGTLYTGCNVEQQYRSHDIHAEVNAIGNMIAGGDKRIKSILIVAKQTKFTPCGACLDWIMQFGGPDTVVVFQGARDGEFQTFTASALMPHYPEI